MNERQDSYWLSTNKSRSHWILWAGYFDEEVDNAWVHQVYAYMPRAGTGAKEAAAALLTAGWRAESKAGSLPGPPEAVVNTGLLDEADIEAIVHTIWPS